MQDDDKSLYRSNDSYAPAARFLLSPPPALKVVDKAL